MSLMSLQLLRTDDDGEEAWERGCPGMLSFIDLEVLGIWTSVRRGEKEEHLKWQKIGSWLTFASTLIGHVVILYAQRYLRQGTTFYWRQKLFSYCFPPHLRRHRPVSPSSRRVHFCYDETSLS